MHKLLFAYTSTRGHTLKILKYIEQHLPENYKVIYLDLAKQENAKLDLSVFKHVIISSSIYYGKYSKSMYKFTKNNKDELNKVDNTFVSINLTARKEGKDKPETSAYIKTFKKKGVWKPKQIKMFAGLLDYPSYNWFDTMMIRFIMKITKGETNTSKTVEYTDWQKVEDFAKQLAK
ncbi:MAG: Protoporphyrinogen IX dehydrogenase [menaquinone] [Proteobacteria bacterium]|nr:MAG: Protoporphyrinogen IX dehydrogenase [menaquinone] [Pseudomonadota bacterium]